MKTPKPYHHRTLSQKTLRPETLMMGYGYDPKLSEGSVKVPLFQTSTFVFENAEAGKHFFELNLGKVAPLEGEEAGLIYSRFNNPNLQILEERLAIWDNAEDCLTFCSGMAAISTSLLAHLRPGDTVVYSEPIYGGTQGLLSKILALYNVRGFGFFPGRDGEDIHSVVATAQKTGPVKVIFIETPANPTNQMTDIAAAAKLRDQLEKDTGVRPLVMVDNTFLGPLWQRPLDHGADLVLYSLTKYVGGHSDLVAGSVAGAEHHVTPIRQFRNTLGTMCDPHTGWLLLRSLETLKIRMTEASNSAERVAAYLLKHPKIEQVDYLGFLKPGTADHDLYQRQCASPGSTFSFHVKGGTNAAFRVLDNLKIIKLAVSLGGTESLASHPATMTHSGLDSAALDRIGITAGLIRLSIGLENPDDLIADLEQALAMA